MSDNEFGDFRKMVTVQTTDGMSKRRHIRDLSEIKSVFVKHLIIKGREEPDRPRNRIQ